MARLQPAGAAAAMVMGLLLAQPADGYPTSTALDPRVAQPLAAMAQAAATQCQMGLAVACQLVPQIQTAHWQLLQAQTACMQGDQNACNYFHMGALQVQHEYQQMLAPPVMPGPMPGGIAPSQLEHALRMQQMQNAFTRQNSDWEAQQFLLEESNRRTLDAITR